MKRLIAVAALLLTGCIAVPAPIRPAPVVYQAPAPVVQKRVVRPAPKPVTAKPVSPAPVKTPAPFGGPVIPGRTPDDGGSDGSEGGADWG